MPLSEQDHDVTVDRSKLASRADTLALASYAFPLLAPLAFYYGYKLRERGHKMGDRVIGQAIGAVVLYVIIVAILF